MSYESEDRYWTDYLRVALPVIGLLLMLALFWWWAQQFIGDDGDPQDVALATQTNIATLPPPTATSTEQVAIAPTESSEQSPTPEGGNGEENGGADETPADGEQPQDCGFVRDQEVVVTTDNLNLRDEPVIDPDNVRETLSEGATVRIVEDCYVEDDEGNQFWRVRDQETSLTGYVAGEYLAPIEE